MLSADIRVDAATGFACQAWDGVVVVHARWVGADVAKAGVECGLLSDVSISTVVICIIVYSNPCHRERGIFIIYLYKGWIYA